MLVAPEWNLEHTQANASDCGPSYHSEAYYCIPVLATSPAKGNGSECTMPVRQERHNCRLVNNARDWAHSHENR